MAYGTAFTVEYSVVSVNQKVVLNYIYIYLTGFAKTWL